ncbi:hypothetical protein HQ496_03400 [bacterium]|nr:hypothetical protein [bacterium]
MGQFADLGAQIENEHKALHVSLNQLDTAFDVLPGPDDFKNWKLGLLWQLRDFQNQLQKHFDLEESGGFTSDMTKIAPHLVSKIEDLEEDHLKIISDLTHILDVLKSIQHAESAKIDRVKCRMEGLLSFIRNHESAENAIIQEAYFQDMGVGD